MTDPHWDIPTEDDLTIPRWARIALAARTVRRMQPLVLASWAGATKKFTRAVENAIAEAELAASQGAVTPDQTAAGMEAMDAYATLPDDADLAGYVVFAAAHASFAARERAASQAAFVIEQAMWAVDIFEKYEKNGAPGMIQAAVDAIWADLRHLMKLAKVGRWNDKTPVRMDVFGPMWSKLPKNWPIVKESQPPKKRRKPATTVRAKKLALPADLVAFLQAGESLDYDPDYTEVGLVTLKRYAHLRLGQCEVSTEGTSVRDKDPYRKKDGEYVVRIVDLIAECDSYDPVGILVWFPDFRCYGCWDQDHHTALTFPDATWSDIVADPGEYLDAQWDGPSDFATHLSPWKHGKFKTRK